jgi:RNA polymerase sigma-70 factor (ECF subfamily)
MSRASGDGSKRVVSPAPRSHDDDAELVSRAAAGDRSAQRALVDRLAGRVRGIALSVLGNKADADDAMQAIFVELMRSLGTFRGGKLVSWADTIAVRTAVRHARHRRVRGARDADIDPEVLASDLRPPPQHNVPRPILEYLAELPETRRVALVLRHVMGYSVEEIAELTGVSSNTVKDRLVTAREQVRKSLRRELGLLPVSRRRDRD